MDNQFQVGDIVEWDQSGIEIRWVEGAYGRGPFEVLDTDTPDGGHIRIRTIPGAKPGYETTSRIGGFTCRPEHIRPSVFLTAVRKANGS